ncbi:unnamed protein product [Blepharisma stoltei]|uniref:Uncharacterized protein n=1 Tax=Blepharisma stoltei TaxID=1481888 RepID=A0AAU9JGI8_9CILI|nr:unnamed protein product [Blepharisma stoltei]
MSNPPLWSGFQSLGIQVAQNAIAKRYFALKRVLITGASSGIGKACAVWLLNQGARVALIGRDLEELEKIGHQFPNQAVAIQCDLAIDRQQYDMVLSAVETFGGLDILINAAGIIFENDLESTYPQDHDYIIDINLRAVYHIIHMCQSFLEKSRGCIVNLSCEWGNRPQQGMISNCMAKAGLEMLTKCLALELAPVRVNAVAPGMTKTNLFKYAGLTPHEIDVLRNRMMKANPMKKIANPDDIVKAVIFLCSKRAANITGQILKVDGGMNLTSSITIDWQDTLTMNAKFAPTGTQSIPRLVDWARKEARKFQGEEVHDEDWVREHESKSNWSTNLADAHIKVTDNYSKLEKTENILSNLEEQKDENGTIYTAENPKAARMIAGRQSQGPKSGAAVGGNLLGLGLNAPKMNSP